MKACNILLFGALLFVAVNLAAEPSASGIDPGGDAALQEQAAQLFGVLKNSGPRFSLSGELKPGKNTQYSINGVDFSVSDKTLVVGSLRIGGHASVRGFINNGAKQASKLILSENEQRTINRETPKELGSAESDSKM